MQREAKQPTRDQFNMKFDIEAKQLAEKFGMSVDEAKVALRKSMREIAEPSKASKHTKEEKLEDNEKRFFGKLYDYGAETIKHPLDRAGQLATEAISSIPAMADVGHYLYHQSGGEQQNIPMRGEEYFIPNEEQQSKNPREYKPLGWSEFTKKIVGDTLKRELDINKAESPFAENVNSVLSVVPQMATFSGAGKLLQKGAKLTSDLANKSKVLGSAGKKGIETLSKAPSAVGKFFEAGSNVKNPVDIASNIGATAAPYALPEEDRSLGMSAGAGLLGAMTGGKLAGSAVRNLPKNRAWKEANKDILKSDAAKIDDMYREAGVTSYLPNVSESDAIRLATKSSEKSMFGSNVQEALANQKQQVSERITPLHANDFHKSEFGEKLKPKFEEYINDIKEDFGNRFDKIRSDVQSKTSGRVVLENVDKYLTKLLGNVSMEPAHIRMWLATPVGQEFQNFYAEGLKSKIKDLYNQGRKQPGFYDSDLGKNINLLKKMIDKDLPTKSVTINGVSVAIDPALEKVLQNQLLKDTLIEGMKDKKYSIHYFFADDVLRNIGAKAGVFKKRFSNHEMADLEGLYGAIRKDITDSVGTELAAKDPKAAFNMQKTLKDYSDFASSDRYDINALASKLGNPIEFVDALSRDKKTKGNKAKHLLNNLTDEERQYFYNNFNRMLGSAGEKSNQPFDPLKWNNRYRSLDKSVKQKIFQKETPYFDKLSNVIEDINKVHSLANTSGSGTHVIGKAEQASILAAAGKAVKNVATGSLLEGLKYVTIGIVPKLIDIGLTNQGIKNLYIKIQNAKTMKDALNALNGISNATTKTSIRTTLKNLYRSFTLLEKEEKNKQNAR